MIKYLLILFCFLISCQDKNGNYVSQDTDYDKQVDSLIIEMQDLKYSLKVEDSMKLILLKSAFAAGYKIGINAGINNPNSSIKQLELIMELDSLRFAIIVDGFYTK